MRRITCTGLLLSALAPLSVGAQGTTGCKPSDDTATSVVEYVKEFLSSTSPQDVALRQSLGLSGVSPSQVSLVTSGQACTKLMSAFNTLAGTPGAPRTAYVVKAGSKGYFVRDPNATAGEYTPTWVFDTKYNPLKPLLGA